MPNARRRILAGFTGTVTPAAIRRRVLLLPASTAVPPTVGQLRGGRPGVTDDPNTGDAVLLVAALLPVLRSSVCRLRRLFVSNPDSEMDNGLTCRSLF